MKIIVKHYKAREVALRACPGPAEAPFGIDCLPGAPNAASVADLQQRLSGHDGSR